ARPRRRGDRVSAPGKLVRSSRWKSGPSKGQRPLGSECCVATGDSGCEAYTAIAWGVGLSHERSDIAGAEGFHSLEGNMCGTVMRGAVALPGSKPTSRAKGSHRNLGDLVSGRRRRVLFVYGGPHRGGEEPKAMMHGQEKSDLVIVAVKPTNKARKAPCGGVCGGGRSGVGGAKGGGQGEYAPAKHVLDSEPGSRVTGAGAYTATCAVTHPRQEKTYAGKRRLWHLHRPYEPMEVAPWSKSMISAAAWPRLIRSRPWWWSWR